jgi:hypothetical protein
MRYLIVLGNIICLILMDKSKRAEFFVYPYIFFSVLWFIIAPSWINGSIASGSLIIALAILFLAKQRNAGEQQ